MEDVEQDKDQEQRFIANPKSNIKFVELHVVPARPTRNPDNTVFQCIRVPVVRLATIHHQEVW